MSFDWRGWLKQPTTVQGIGGVAATLTAGLVGGVPLPVLIGGVVGSAVLIVLPDNTQAASEAQKLAAEVVTDTANHTLTVAIPQLLSDALGVLTKIATPKPGAPGPSTIAILIGTIGLGLGLSLAACSTPLPAGTAATVGAATTQAITAVATAPAAPKTVPGIGCLVDKALVPIADATVAALVPQAAPGVSIDQLLIHPAILNLCAGIGGKPVAAASTANP